MTYVHKYRTMNIPSTNKNDDAYIDEVMIPPVSK